jgi:hypothetical protein
MEPEGKGMTTTTFNPRNRLTIQQARRLACSIQSPDDVTAQLADMRAREEAARAPVDAVPLTRTRARKASSGWSDAALLVAALAVVAMAYVGGKALL